MHTCVANYGRLLLIIGVMGFLAVGPDRWEVVGPALLGVVALVVTCGPLRTPDATVAAVAGALVAALALFTSGSAVADLPAALGGDGLVDGALTLSRALTSLVSLAVLLAIAAQLLQGPRLSED